ncbi:hypothetical protein KGQ34_00475 [Patescibacteria group bacterium]|nr:hypothetical protein [Patescibacteria group bacterium]
MKGTSIIELIIYGAILAFISLFAVHTLLTVTAAFSQARTERLINENGNSIMERLMREIRFAQAVDDASVLGANPSDLILKTFASPTDDTPASIEFSSANKNLLFKTRAGNTIQLNADSIAVPVFTATKLINGSTVGIKFQLALQASSTKINIQKIFYGTAILRGSY